LTPAGDSKQFSKAFLQLSAACILRGKKQSIAMENIITRHFVTVIDLFICMNRPP
jgi:hypothetical protein